MRYWGQLSNGCQIAKYIFKSVKEPKIGGNGIFLTKAWLHILLLLQIPAIEITNFFYAKEVTGN